jgi:RNA polymerase sigma-70 factor (ECF subfamily)
MTEWTQILQQHGAAVWSTVYRLLGREADAADCFQNVFLSALEISRQGPIRHWPALLQRLATARALECLRRRYRRCDRRTVSLDAPMADPRASEPMAVLTERELAVQLREALIRLDERQAHVFCRACLDGASYREIAGELDITVNHVGVLLNRARSILREQLRDFATGDLTPISEATWS